MKLTKENVLEDLKEKLEKHPEVYQNIALQDE
jgi:hypothetical protein